MVRKISTGTGTACNFYTCLFKSVRLTIESVSVATTLCIFVFHILCLTQLSEHKHDYCVELLCDFFFRIKMTKVIIICLIEHQCYPSMIFLYFMYL